jgi:hypothetical protein
MIKKGDFFQVRWHYSPDSARYQCFAPNISSICSYQLFLFSFIAFHRKNIVRIVDETLKISKLQIEEIDAIAVTNRPGKLKLI